MNDQKAEGNQEEMPALRKMEEGRLQALEQECDVTHWRQAPGPPEEIGGTKQMQKVDRVLGSEKHRRGSKQQ